MFDQSATDTAVTNRLTQTLYALRAKGGTVVDTSPMYGNAEATLGALAEREKMVNELFIAAKVWTRGEQEGIRQMTDSMGLLRRKTVDLMQVHNLVDWRVHLATLRRWKDEGRVRYIGVTHYAESAYDELAEVIRREPVDFVQFAYSPRVRAAERSLLPTAADRGIAVLVNRPFEEGAALRRLASTPLPSEIAEWATSWPEACLKFIIADPAVTCVIPATGNPHHAAANMAAAAGRLPTPGEREQLSSLMQRGT